MMTGAAKIAGVMGWPVRHSLSPLLHGYWLKEYGVDGALVPLAVPREDFVPALTGLRKAGFVGVNVTVPHKEAAFALADSCDPVVELTGAANLLTFAPDGKIAAYNTDALGLRDSLQSALGEAVRGQTVILLGAGGAARGAVVALDRLGAENIHILNRDVHRAQILCASLGPKVNAMLMPGGLDRWHLVAGQAALVVNSTSAGMKGKDPLTLSLDQLAKKAAVCDIVYNPLETDLLKAAKARGHQTIDGLGMLMHQAAPSFEAFFGIRPDVTPGLRAILEQALARG